MNRSSRILHDFILQINKTNAPSISFLLILYKNIYKNKHILFSHYIISVRYNDINELEDIGVIEGG